jgi:hypothetical protein
MGVVIADPTKPRLVPVYDSMNSNTIIGYFDRDIGDVVSPAAAGAATKTAITVVTVATPSSITVPVGTP